MHSWKDSSGIRFNSVVTAFLMASISGKRTLWWPPWAWRTEKITRSQVRWIGRMIQHGDVSLSQELMDAQGIVSWRVVLVKQLCIVLPQLTPLLTHRMKQAPQDLFIDMSDCLIWHDCLTPVARTPCGRFLSLRRTRSAWAWFWTSTVLLSLASATMDTSTEGSGAWSPVTLEDPRLITSDDSLQQVWLSLEILENVLTHLHAPLLLVIVQKLRHHLRTDLPHTQIFCDNLPHAVMVDFQLICYHSNSQPTIATHHLLHALNIVHSPAR